MVGLFYSLANFSLQNGFEQFASVYFSVLAFYTFYASKIIFKNDVG